MSSLLSNAKTIALVGNGEVAKADAARIDDHEVVVRINRAQLCGCAGTRTDALALVGPKFLFDVCRHSAPMNMRAVSSAREFWSAMPPQPDDADLMGSFYGRRPLVYIDAQAGRNARDGLIAHGANARVKPSTGAIVLAYLLDVCEAEITLFGFSHRGGRVHQWSAERCWMDSLANGPRVVRASDAGPPVQLPLPLMLSTQLHRFANHLAAGRF